eukprot:CAMPEP_0172312342 /NCGR_PEP_ID=MMETSP1058-20130122/17139_1 /TAXON_ID=83371 /ORGANISM="Detonula confervacea, Strain CCMP 353" /LENGTH=253 /DNA_ID=CAMNT_0013025761 /DNA_START=235 /DNA_END=996 /DNA_ORIENTATION=-
MAGKRARQPTEAEATNASAASLLKSPMEESADALAGVEGAFSKRKAIASTGNTPKKKSAKMTKSETVQRPRSNSIEQLAEYAGSLLRDDPPSKGKKGASSIPSVADVAAFAAAAMAAAASVPNPMADAAARMNNNGMAVPTGFRKKGAASAAGSNLSDTEVDMDGKSKKSQITYNPDIPMTKEQLTSWRREMRRVRNRESAAASRRKVRDRIEELEDEVDVWKKRYHEVTVRLGQAEGGKKKKNGKSEEEVQV